MKDKKKNAWLGDFMCNVIGGVREYRVNKITYIVEARCRPVRENGNVMPQEKFAKLIKNGPQTNKKPQTIQFLEVNRSKSLCP